MHKHLCTQPMALYAAPKQPSRNQDKQWHMETIDTSKSPIVKECPALQDRFALTKLDTVANNHENDCRPFRKIEITISIFLFAHVRLSSNLQREPHATLQPATIQSDMPA
ncbi:Uncharacterised protein [Collinsella intestinalis]|nr:Uncharacterised protein [Collinsella intestinalis]